jgi:hypothetical protein
MRNLFEQLTEETAKNLRDNLAMYPVSIEIITEDLKNNKFVGDLKFGTLVSMMEFKNFCLSFAQGFDVQTFFNLDK